MWHCSSLSPNKSVLNWPSKWLREIHSLDLAVLIRQLISCSESIYRWFLELLKVGIFTCISISLLITQLIDCRWILSFQSCPEERRRLLPGCSQCSAHLRLDGANFQSQAAPFDPIMVLCCTFSSIIPNKRFWIPLTSQWQWHVDIYYIFRFIASFLSSKNDGSECMNAFIYVLMLQCDIIQNLLVDALDASMNANTRPLLVPSLISFKSNRLSTVDSSCRRSATVGYCCTNRNVNDTSMANNVSLSMHPTSLVDLIDLGINSSITNIPSSANCFPIETRGTTFTGQEQHLDHRFQPTDE